MRRLRPQFVATCAAALLLAGVAAAQETRPDQPGPPEAAVAVPDLEQLLRESKAFREQTLANLAPPPDLPEGASLLVTAQTDDRLIIDVDRAVRAGAYRLALPGGPAALRVRVRGGNQTWLDLMQPEVATRQTLSPGGSGLINGFVAFFSSPEEGRLQVSRNADFVGGTLSVALTQDPFDGGATVVRLNISFSPTNENAGDPPAAPVRIELEADSISAVRRSDPEAFDQYVVPMFRSLGLGSVVDGQVRAMAEQVFLEALPVADDVREQALRQIKLLDDANFMTRRRAQVELRNMGRPAATVAAGLEWSSLSSEQRAQLTILLERYRRLSIEEMRQLRRDDKFLASVIALSGDIESDQLSAAAQEALEQVEAE